MVAIMVIFVIVLAIFAVMVLFVGNAEEADRERQLKNVSQWLLYAVIIAEKEYGGGMGKVKLREVYSMFIDKFPKVAAYLTFEKFSIMVDSALVEMKYILDTNINVKNYVG